MYLIIKDSYHPQHGEWSKTIYKKDMNKKEAENMLYTLVNDENTDFSIHRQSKKLVNFIKNGC